MNCEFSKCDVEVNHDLLCLRYPPKVFVAMTQGPLGQPLQQHISIYPPMLPANWCGEWAQGETKVIPKVKGVAPGSTLKPVRS